MINVRELKIGNWLQHFEFGYMQALDINLIGKGGRETVNGWEDKEWSPIPLTAELLFKIGKPHKTEYHQYELNDVFFVVWDGVDAVWFRKIGRNDFQFVTTEYLHQLQNLYFALTGKELEIPI